MSQIAGEKKRYSTKYVVNMIITLVLMFGFGFLPTFGPVTPIGMKILGIFLGIVYGYSSCDVIWPSLFAIIAYGISGYTTMGEAITSMMGHNVVFQSIVVFISAGALEYYGFGKWFVRWSLSLKIFKGKPMLYVWTFMTLFGLASIVVSPIVLLILLSSIWVNIAENCGYEKNSNFVYVGLGGILLGSCLGGAMIPYTSWQYGLAMTWGQVTGTPLNFGIMAAMTIPATILILTVYVFLSKAIFKIDYSHLKAYDASALGDEDVKLRPRLKRILIVFLISVLLVILANTFMNTGFADFINNKLSTAGIFCLCAAILLILPSGEGDGKACIEFNQVKNTAISWQVILMCAVTLPIAGAVTNSSTGIVELLSNLLSPVFAGHGAFFIIVFTCIATIILTNVGSNIAFGAAMVPILTPFVMASGMSSTVAGAAMIYLVNAGMVLPGASAPAAIFHANEAIPNGGMRIKVTLVGCLCMLIVSIPLFSLFTLFVK